MRTVRQNFKRRFDNLPEESKQILKKNSSSVNKGICEPKVESSLLHETIMKIAIQTSEGRYEQTSEVIETVRTLDDLTIAVEHLGFQLYNSLYFHLLPRNSITFDGKRHLSTIPAQLSAKKYVHSCHPDSMFAEASVGFMEEVSGILGPQEVCFLSQDDKARVAIGLTTANDEAPLLMNMEYKGKLSEEDFLTAPSHKLITSVLAAVSIRENIFTNEAVSYSGPTYIGIRSANNHSSAYQHLSDIKHIHELEEFKEHIYRDDGFVKPILMVTVDGGPDESPRYDKTIKCAVDYFLNYNLDAIFVASNPAGRSAFSQIKKRIDVLSKELARVVLPHEHFGTHLDNFGSTIDDGIEKRNFAQVGGVLSEIWSQINIDNFPTVAQFTIEPASEDIIEKNVLWHQQHVRESQYFLQIVKCQNSDCCNPPRSSYFNLVKERFLPPPMPMMQTREGLICVSSQSSVLYPSLVFHIAIGSNAASEKTKNNYHKGIPYDISCPTLCSLLPKRVCKTCGLYFSSTKRVDMHQKQCGLAPIDMHYLHALNRDNKSKVMVRPVRIITRRGGELLCVVHYGLDTEDFEWHDEENVVVNYGPIIEANEDSGTPLYTNRSKGQQS